MKESRKYQVVVTGLDALPQGKEIELAIRDLSAGTRKYDCRYAMAIVERSAEKLPDGDTLRLISSNGFIYPDFWRIKIVKELGPYPSPDYRKASWLTHRSVGKADS